MAVAMKPSETADRAGVDFILSNLSRDKLKDRDSSRISSSKADI